MTSVRLVLRLVTLVALCGGSWLALLVRADLPDRLRRIRGLPPAGGRRRARIQRAWARRVAALLGMRIEARGKPPEPPFLLVANHLGYIDVILLASHLECAFVAKSEVAGWPVVGALCRAANVLFISRGNPRDIPRVTGQIERILEGGRGVVIFPEGTSTRGESVIAFRPSLLEAAARTGHPVSYASLSYSTPPGCRPAHLAVCWWGEMGFTAHLLDLLRLPGFRATLTFGEKPIRATDRKVLASRLQDAVERQFEAVV